MNLCTRRIGPAILAIAFVLPAIAVRAEEGGSGHYLPGSLASFMDGVSPTETFILRANVVDYAGSIDAGREVPIAGLTALDVKVDSEALGLTAFWHPHWGRINDRWSYAMSATVPLVNLDVDADVEVGIAPGATVRRSGSDSGVGDILLMPLMLNYAVSPDLNVNFRVSVIAPTGSYETGRLANTGKNFWTVEPALGLMYLGQKNGREASAFFGIDFNTENDDTDYKSGTQAHLDVTVAQHFPLWGGLAGAGATGYWYQQVQGDSGDGATLGDFKARAHGIGPVVSFIKPFGKTQLLAELKWISEFDVRNRPEGDIIFFKAMYKFY